MNDIIHFLLNLGVLFFLLLISYALRLKMKNRWKAYPLLPFLLLLTIVLYLLIFNLLDFEDWVLLQFNLLISKTGIAHDLLLLLILLISFTFFILFKILFKFTIGFWKTIPQPFFGIVKEDNVFYIYPAYYYYSDIFRFICITVFSTIIVYSYFWVNAFLIMSDLFLILCFELLLLFPKKKEELSLLDVTFNSIGDKVEDEPLINYQKFEIFYNEIQQDLDLKNDIQLSVQQKIRVVKD